LHATPRTAAPTRFGPVVRDQLLRWASVLDIEICAYTVMPDHVHLLARVTAGTLSGFVGRWKQATGYIWKRSGNRQPLWQRGFYDRVLRHDEDPRRVAAYIACDPVRTRLVARPEDHR
jgi:REP element-mobilizing transposase RayT